MGLNYGLEFSLHKLGALTSLTPLFDKGVSYNMFKIATAMVSEPLEELYIDPMLEAYVTNKVAEIGGDAASQILISGIAESGREGLSGGISLLTKSGTNVDAQIQVQAHQMHNLNPELSFSEHIQLIKETQIKQQNKQDYITEGLSTILMFTGALTGGILGSIGTGLGTVLIGIGASVEALDSLKDVYKSVLQSKQYKADVDIQLRALSQERIRVLIYGENAVSTLPELSIPPLSQETVKIVKDITSTDTNKIIDWISRYKKGLVVAAYGIVGVVGAMFPAVGAVLSVIPGLTIGMVKSEFDLLGNFIENSQEQIVQLIMEVSATNNIQELKNFLKKHFAVRVITNSMKDKLRTGDIVAAKKVRRFSRYNIGDIIVFIRDGVKIVHEIVNIKYENFRIKYETKGINNVNPDNKLVSKKDILGKVVMSTKNLDILLDLVRQGKMTIYDAFGMEKGKRPKSTIPAEIWVIERARTVATGMELMGFQLKMSQQEFTIACIEANKKGIRDLTTVQFRFEHLEDYGGCGRIFWSSIDGFESRINNCPMCGTKNSEDITRIIADHVFSGKIKSSFGRYFEKEVSLHNIIDPTILLEYALLSDARIDMYANIKINGKTYHVVIEHDGKQHDQDDPIGAFNAYLGIQAANGRFTTEEINKILANRRSTEYKTLFRELKEYWDRDNEKNRLFSDLKQDGYILIRVPNWEIRGDRNIQEHIIREFKTLTGINIPCVHFYRNILK